jgi:AbrB family looped-hinge helix DNA binding protein
MVTERSSGQPWYSKHSMSTGFVSPEGEIAVPPEVRRQLGLEPGTELTIDVQGESLVVRRVARHQPDWRTMRGMVRTGPSLTKELAQEHADELARDDA